MDSLLCARLSDVWANVYFVFIYFIFLSFREDWFALLFSLSQVFFYNRMRNNLSVECPIYTLIHFLRWRYHYHNISVEGLENTEYSMTDPTQTI